MPVILLASARAGTTTRSSSSSWVGAGLGGLGAAPVGVGDVERGVGRAAVLAGVRDQVAAAQVGRRGRASANCPSVKTLRKSAGWSSRMNCRCVCLGGQHQVGVARAARAVSGRLRKPSSGRRASSSGRPSRCPSALSRKPWVPALLKRDRGVRAGELPGEELHVRRAADVGGADEEDLEGIARGRGLGCLARSAAPPPPSAGRGSRPRRSADEDVVEGVLDGAAGGVDADVGVLGLLVGRGDAGELGDLAARGPWRRGPCGRGARTPRAGWRRGPGRRRRRRRRPSPAPAAGSRRTARSGCTTATPPCREISAATQPIRRMLVSRSSLEKVRPAERLRRTTSPSRLVTVRAPCSRTRSISARASVDLPLPDRPVKKSTRPWSAGAGRSCVDDRLRSSAGRRRRSSRARR